MRHTVAFLLLALLLAACLTGCAGAGAPAVATPEPTATPTATPTPTPTPTATPTPTPTPVPATDVLYDKDGFVIRFEGYGRTGDVGFYQFSVENQTDDVVVLYPGYFVNPESAEKVTWRPGVEIDGKTYLPNIGKENMVAVAPNAVTWVYMRMFDHDNAMDIPTFESMTVRFGAILAGTGKLDIAFDTDYIVMDMTSTHISGIDKREKAREEAAAAGEYAGLLFRAKDLNGNTVDESIVSEHTLTVLQFWATWCGPCKKELPTFAKLYPEYEEKGCAFLGVQTDANIEEAKTLWEKYEVPYPSIQECDDLHEISLFEIKSIPTTILLDQNGNRIGEPHVGLMSEKAMRKLLDDTLGNLSGATEPAAASPDPA